MGAVTDELAVVDPELRLIGMKNIRVVDASVFPLMVTANPMITGELHLSLSTSFTLPLISHIPFIVFIIAEKAADMILASYAKASQKGAKL